MATVTHRVVTPSTSNVTSYASGSFTPSVNDLLIVMVYATATIAAGSLTGSTGPTFTKIRSNADALGATLYLFVANSLITSATAQTVTFDCTGDAATGAIINVASVSGMSKTGTSAILQSTSATHVTSSVPTSTFTSTTNTNNAIITVYGCLDPVATPASAGVPSTFTSGTVTNTTIGSPFARSEYAYKNSGSTITAVTWSSNTSAGLSSSIELDTSAITIVLPPVVMRSGGIIGS